MSTTIHKYTVTSTDVTAPRVDIHKRFSEIFGSMPGVVVNKPLIQDGNAFAIVYGLEPGKGQVVFYAMGNLQTPTCYFGLCSNSYVPRIISGSLYSPETYWFMMPSTIGDETVSDMAIAVKDNKVIGLSQRVSGFVLFHHTEDGVIADRQLECISNFGQQWTVHTGVNFNGGGISGSCGDCIREKPGLTAMKFEGTSYGNVITANVSNYNLPTGKILKYESVIWDSLGGVKGVVKDYPVQMTGAGVVVDPKSYPSYKTIQIDTQKYIHMGANCWLPYDSIVEHSETV